MNNWTSLYREHQGLRRPARTWTTDVRNLLRGLASAGHCDRSVSQRFSDKRSGASVEWSIRRRETAGVGEPLVEIGGLRSTTLSVLATAGRDGSLHQFDIRAEGERHDGTRWVIAVHLSDDRGAGGDRHALGACGHAALHCHVGPDLNAVPKIRVPLPALGPVEALEWVLSQLIAISEFEPAPWAEVQAALKKA